MSIYDGRSASSENSPKTGMAGRVCNSILGVTNVDYKKLSKYKYSCIDRSLLTKWVYGRLWSFFEEYIPRTLAPNTITLIGFSFILVSTLTTIFVDPQLLGNRPYISLLNCACLFIYQLLDALDGRQARRLNCSTPLGQLFDHGCDTLSTALIAIGLSSSLRLGAGKSTVVFLFSLLFGFYMVTLEEHFTNIFELGYINGATEGIFIAKLVHLLGFLGILNKIPYTWSNNIYFISICLLVTAILIVCSLHKILAQSDRSAYKHLLAAVTRMIMLFFLTFYPTLELKISNQLDFFSYVLSATILFSKMTIDIIILHMSKGQIPLIDPFFVIYAILFVVFRYLHQGFINLRLCHLIWTLSVYLYVIQYHIDRICEYLKISCFSIVCEKLT